MELLQRWNPTLPTPPQRHVPPVRTSSLSSITLGGRASVWTKPCPQYEVGLLPRERERNVLFNDALNTFYLRLYGIRHMVKDHLLYAPSHRQDSTYHSLCYTSRATTGKLSSLVQPKYENSQMVFHLANHFS